MGYRFYDYTLDPASREIRHGTHRLALEPKVFQVLLYLLEHRDRVVPKAELFEQCWPETFVSESALTRCLARLRKAVQPTPTAPPVIETRHRQGYRFVAEVTVLTQPLPPAAGGTARLSAQLSLQTASPAVPPGTWDAPAPSAPPHSASLSASPVRHSSRAERRQLTVMVCEVVDSASLAGQLDPEDLREVMVRYQATCTAVIARYGGHVAQYQGDELLVYFGWPQAHEDDARRAVHTGLALVTAGQALKDELRQAYSMGLALRVGIHTGLVVVGAGEGETPYGQLAVGATPNLAAKLQGLAAPNTVVLSDATYQLVQGYVVCQPLEARHLPGTPGLGALYQVLDASEARGRLDLTAPQHRTPFVGREVELAVLRARAAQVRQGQGQAVLLSGEAGMGKSRLVQEVATALALEGFSLIECQGSPYSQHTALHPVIEWVQRCIQGDGVTPEPARVAQLEHFVQQAQLDCHESLPLLAALVQLDLPASRYPVLQLSPQRQRQCTLEVLLALILARAARQPVFLIVEDLHWVDPTTLEWLGLVMAQGPTAPFLTLLTCRPTFASPWGGRTHVMHLTLPRLASQPGAQMVQWLGDDQLSAAQVQHIVTHTDGIPLFVEEVAKLVLAAHRLQGHAGPAASGSATPETRIPATLRDALMARLDQLGPAKGTAQLGTTLGREFSMALLLAVAPLEEALVSQDLAQLVEAELLYQRGAGAAAVYMFKHALIQEAAYASLLRTTRQHYHQHIVQVLEAQFPDTVTTQPELLAHHARCGEVWDKAVVYCRQAGGKALAQSAHREAVGYFEQALSALQQLPETRAIRAQAIDLRLALRTALHPSGDYGRSLTVLREAETLAEALNDPGRLAQVSGMLSNHFYNMGTYDQAIAAGQRALALATASGDLMQQALAHHHLALAYYNQGDYRRAIEGYGQTVMVLDGVRRPEHFGQVLLPAVAYRARLASCHAELGAFTEGRVLGDEGLRIAEAAAHPASRMYASWSLGLLSLRQGDLARALSLLQRAVGLCQEADLLLYFPWVAVALGAAYTLAGRVADAVPLLTQAMDQSLTMHMVFCQVLCRLPLGEAQSLAGRLDDAQTLAAQALAQARAHQERGHEASALRLLGDIAARREPPGIEPAESHYQQTLTLAGELGMRPLQAHCHLRLGTLYARVSQREQAHAELSAAIDLYRAMGMTFWLPQVEAVLVQVVEG